LAFAKEKMKPMSTEAFSIWLSPTNGTDGNSFTFRVLTNGMDAATAKWATDGPWGINNAVFADSRSPIGDKLVFWVVNGKLSYPAIVVQFKNDDGTDGYYMVYDLPALMPNGEINEAGMDELFDGWLNNMVYQPPFSKVNWIENSYVKDYLEKNDPSLLDLIEDADGNIQKLLFKWCSSYPQVIPKELEIIPLLGQDDSTPGNPWVK
jgi:hypothetical protein